MQKNLVEMELEIRDIMSKQDKRWPLEISLNNSENGYRVDKLWIQQFYVNWHPIIDHPRRLFEILNKNDSDMRNRGYPEKVISVLTDKYGSDFVNSFSERLLIAQPYNYRHEDVCKLDKYCKENNLKYERRWNSPYYIGTHLVIIYEDDEIVDKFVQYLLEIQDAEFGNFSTIREKAKADRDAGREFKI